MRIFDFRFFNEIQISCDFAFYALKYFKFFIFRFCFCVDLKNSYAYADLYKSPFCIFLRCVLLYILPIILEHLCHQCPYFHLVLCSLSDYQPLHHFVEYPVLKKVDYPKIRKFGDLPSSKHDDVISEGCISEANLQKASFGSIKSVSISVEFGFNLFWTTKSISILLLSEKIGFNSKVLDFFEIFIKIDLLSVIEDWQKSSTCLVQ